jgi:polyisoprenoid-binding protein YceI
VTVTFQPTSTSILWTLSDPLHTVHGTFKLKQGVVNFNLDDGSADGLIEIDATSGESGNSPRDRRIHKDGLESDRYPVVSFRPSMVR